jgi:hypothetical protein
MTIHIVDDAPDIYLTREQYNQLLAEYQKAFQFFSGTPPTFEHWVAQRGSQCFTNPILSSGTL